ncbi:MAG: hypothetical protein O3A47_11140 [Chloroflexi bacterium]|nr:hypothetical protein [Chloroflexota bacterium]
MKKYHVYSAAIVIAALMVGGGCASSRPDPVLKVEPMPESLRYSEQIGFDSELAVPEIHRLQDEQDPEEWVRFGISLSDRGRHHAAGEVFEEASERFSSRGSAYEVRCLAAAANEYKDSGDMEKFRNCLKRLRSTCDRYQLAGAGRELSILLALGDVASGKVTDREWYPREVKELIRSK